MLNIVFFSALVLYFLCSVCQFIASALKKDKLGKIAFAIFLIAFLLHTGYLIARGFIAKRIPMSNQFEFATSFAWGISLLLIILRKKYVYHPRPRRSVLRGSCHGYALYIPQYFKIILNFHLFLCRHVFMPLCLSSCVRYLLSICRFSNYTTIGTDPPYPL